MFQTQLRGLTLAIVLAFAAAAAQAAPYAAYVMDARTGKVLHSSNADTKLHPASLTKMMTLYIVFDEVRRGRLSLDQKVKISQNAASEPPSKLGLRAGQTIELRYLIRAAAIKSANDAATALGEAVAGSEAAFASRMDAYARAMGMRNTTFKNAHGLTETGHMSTAHDMAILGRRIVYDFPQYYNLFSRNSTSAGIKTVSNTNRRLLDAYQGADGIKTGYTRAAGFNLVSSAKRGDKRVIVSMFGGKTSSSRNAEVARLMDLGFSQMPRRAAVVPPPPLNAREPVAAVAIAAPASAIEPVRGSVAGVVAAPQVIALARVDRPMPRSTGMMVAATRNSAAIAAAVAEVNAELAAAAPSSRILKLGALVGRPAPRPGTGAQSAAVVVAPLVQSASTFASAPAPELPPARTEAMNISMQQGDATNTTGRNDWGVQIGSFRAKGDAERQLLTTALQDVPQLNGGLRRIESAKVDGVTVFRAQFVGLSQTSALTVCETLQRRQAPCLPLAPGT